MNQNKLKKVLLHVGCEKTGTTSIQAFLYQNRHVLKSSGILITESLAPKNNTKIAIYAARPEKGLTRYIPGGKTIETFRAEIKNALMQEVSQSDCEQAVITCEWLHSKVFDDDEFEVLKDLLFTIAEEVEVIIYIRPQDKLAVSHYSTALKAGFSNAFRFPKTQPDIPYYYNFEAIYLNWRKHFGAGNVHVRMFDRAQLKDGDLLKDFSEFLPGDVNYNYAIEAENQSLNEHGMHLMRALNYWHQQGQSELSEAAIKDLRWVICDTCKGKANVADTSDSETFFAAFEESNKRLAEEYLKDTGKTLRFQ